MLKNAEKKALFIVEIQQDKAFYSNGNSFFANSFFVCP